MAVIRWNPWTLSDFMENNWDLPTVPGLSRLMGQGLNIYETDDEVVAEAAVPGVPENDISVTIDDGVVRIMADVEEKKEEKDKRKYYMTSMSSSFQYSFRLPSFVFADEEPAVELEDGVLKLRFKKVQKAPPKKLKIAKRAKKANN